jgi:hypothetical protein
MHDSDGTHSNGEYDAVVRCGPCGRQVAEPKAWLHDPPSQRQPCPSCGTKDSWVAEVGVTDVVRIHEFVGVKGKTPGRKKPVFELKTGHQLEQSTGRWMRSIG